MCARCCTQLLCSQKPRGSFRLGFSLRYRRRVPLLRFPESFTGWETCFVAFFFIPLNIYTYSLVISITHGLGSPKLCTFRLSRRNRNKTAAISSSWKFKNNRFFVFLLIELRGRTEQIPKDGQCRDLRQP